tara:strand:- start:66 stop:644 length:579 start_codon:yes stop_codon:yes gene_type:complete
MANHVYSRTNVSHDNPEEIKILSRLLEGPIHELASYLIDREITDDELDRNIMCETFGAKWIDFEDFHAEEDEIIIYATSAWSYPIEMWEILENKGFSIDADYEDEMPNFFGSYSTAEGDNCVDIEPVTDAVDETIESFECDSKESSDYNNKLYEECLASAKEAIDEMTPGIEQMTEQWVERYLEFQEHYVGE